MQRYEAGHIPKMGDMRFIYGDGGTGKTSLIKQFEGKKLLLSFDGSTNALLGTNDIDVTTFDHTDAPQMQKLVLDEINGRAPGHQVLMLDNITAMQNWVLDNINHSKDNRQNYQELQLWFRNFGMFLRSLTQYGITIIVTAHQVDLGSAGIVDKGRFTADMNEKTFNAFTGAFDVVGRIYKQEGQRWIDLDTENGNHAKNRLDNRTKIKAEDLLIKETEEK